MKNYKRFVEDHKLRSSDINTQQIVDLFTTDMLNGLVGEKSTLRMIPTYIEAENQFLTEVPVVAVDAGGTNFRAALVKFNIKGKLEISNLMNARMPGLEGEISKAEFFKTIAGYVKPNGELLQFCKEVQAPEVVGELIGKSLLETLGMEEKQIVLLNDTVATLLAGKSASVTHEYDSYIGYILGTGTNTCYVESNKNILKLKTIDSSKSQIINIESGKFDKVTRTDLDIIFDKTTVNTDDYRFEKMIAGGYLGGLCLSVLKSASKEDVFTPATAASITSLEELSSEDVSDFATHPASGKSPLHKCCLL